MSIYKALSAVAAAAFVAAIVVAIPSPEVEARTPTPVVQIDRLDVQPAAPDCSEQAWPYYDASCLRGARSNNQTRAVRVVTADRGAR